MPLLVLQHLYFTSINRLHETWFKLSLLLDDGRYLMNIKCLDVHVYTDERTTMFLLHDKRISNIN